MPFLFRPFVRLGLASALLLSPLAQAATTFSWSAASGLLPNQVDSRMYLEDTAPTEDPVLAAGSLSLTTSVMNSSLAYFQLGTALDFPQQLVIEAEMRLGPGELNPGGSPASFRAWASIVFLPSERIGNALLIEPDRISLFTGQGGVGVSAIVDTDDAFHRYRIVVDNAAAGSPYAPIHVYQDEVLVLTGETNASVAFARPPSSRISWGDQSSAALGTSEWRSFSHNASAVPEPASWLTLSLGVLGCLVYRGRRHRPKTTTVRAPT